MRDDKSNAGVHQLLGHAQLDTFCTPRFDPQGGIQPQASVCSVSSSFGDPTGVSSKWNPTRSLRQKPGNTHGEHASGGLVQTPPTDADDLPRPTAVTVNRSTPSRCAGPPPATRRTGSWPGSDRSRNLSSGRTSSSAEIPVRKSKRRGKRPGASAHIRRETLPPMQ